MANWLLIALLLRISDAARRPASTTPGGRIPGPPGTGTGPPKMHEAPTEVVR
jgi:hypothetical protein